VQAGAANGTGAHRYTTPTPARTHAHARVHADRKMDARTAKAVKAAVLDAAKGQRLAHVGGGKVVNGGHARLQAERNGPACAAWSVQGCMHA